jgi:GT2 family glycosyltransferase
MKDMSPVNKEQKKLEGADLLIIVVNWNTKVLLSRCLKSLQICQDAVRFDVVIVDNGSKDGSAEMVKAEFPNYCLLRNEENLGFSKANNIVFRYFPQYTYYLLLNSDASVSVDAIKTLLSFLKMNSDMAAVGPALKLPNGRYQAGGAGWGPSWIHAFNSFFLLSNINRSFRGLFIYQEHYAENQWPVMVDWLAGACLLVRATALEDTGLFDERYFVYGEDADWCWRARGKGWKIAYLPYVSVLHEFGASSTLKVSLSWFLNLVDAVKERGGRINYVLFLICGLIGYSIRLITYTLQYALKKNRGLLEYKRQCQKLLNICYKLLFLPKIGKS